MVSGGPFPSLSDLSSCLVIVDDNHRAPWATWHACASSGCRASEKIIKGHIVDVEVESGAPVLVIRDLGGRTLRRPTQPGAFVINCTDHLSDLGQNASPILDPSGLVCSPQLSCGFPGPSANLITHLFYLGRLEEMWRTLPHSIVGDKSKIGIELMMVVILVPTIARRYLGAEHRNDWDSPANFEMPAEVAFPVRGSLGCSRCAVLHMPLLG